mgnify:FL=1
MVLDSLSPTSVGALLTPLAHLEVSVAVWAPQRALDFLPLCEWETREVSASELVHRLSGVRQVLSAGHYLPLGHAAYQKAEENGWKYCVVQHGLMTPFAPPLPANSTLFAFSEADAEFWKSGRTDVTQHVVGSQMFYEATKKPKVASENIAEQPVFLGQMHGAELPRPSFARASYKFCKDHQAIYRPHPSEKDRLSTITHKLWAKQGIEVDHSAVPLNELNNPVVSVFSTGVLEAAMRGIPAWVYHPNPPEWLLEFWNRYGMHQWGSEPTPAPVVPECEPAQEIARLIATILEK